MNQIVEFREKEEIPTEMEYIFYLVIVKKASAEENEEAPVTSSGIGGVPKFYLKPVTIVPLDTFSATHGPFTDVDGKGFIFIAYPYRIAHVTTHSHFHVQYYLIQLLLLFQQWTLMKLCGERDR